MSCKFCEREDKCYEHCQESATGCHMADTNTFHLEQDGDGVYLDVNCIFCGQSGCVGRFEADDVDWD